MAIQDYFKGKRIAVIGLGPHGGMAEDAKFLIKSGALVSIYDLKSEARLKSHLVFLRSIGLANYVCGSIPPEDLMDMDLIILSHEYPRSSSFLKAVNEKNIAVEYPETLFFKRSPAVVVVGVIGEYGKSSVLSLLAPMLESVCSSSDEQAFFVLDSESEDGIISCLKKIRSGDIVLMKISAETMVELHTIRISPQVAVFASVPSPSLQGSSPFEVLDFQTYNNFIIASDEIVDATHELKIQPKAKMLRTKASIIPESWGLTFSGEHDKHNAALALQTARLFKVDDEAARDILIKRKAHKGRMEMIKKVRGVEFYNDSASVRPASTVKAIQSLSLNKNLVLIFGGAKCQADYSKLYVEMPKHVRTLILLPGSGTMAERFAISKIEDVAIFSAPSVEEAVRMAMEQARKNDRVLFSPGFEAVGIDNSRKERGERFVKSVRGL